MPLFGLVGFVLLHATLKVWIFSGAFLYSVADPVYDLTGGLITHSAAAGMLETVVLLGFLTAVVNTRPGDYGLRWPQLPSAIVVTAFAWAVVQVLTVIVGRIDDGLLTFGRTWSLAPRDLGASVLQAQTGGAFIEEIIYRGVLLPQLFVLLGAATRWRPGTIFMVALFGSQVYFALAHVPAALRAYSEPWTGTSLYLLQVLFVGIFFAAVYLRTSNLFVAMGLHALINFPGELFAARIDPFLVALVVCCGILIAWPYLSRSLGDVFTLTPSLVQADYSAAGRRMSFDDHRAVVS